MVPNHISECGNQHWAVSSNTDFFLGGYAGVLVQLTQGYEQVRLRLTADQAEDMAAALMRHAAKARAAEPFWMTPVSDAVLATFSPEAVAQYHEVQRLQGEGPAPGAVAGSHST